MTKSYTATVIYSVFENQPSKTHGEINISKFILGAVIKKSSPHLKNAQFSLHFCSNAVKRNEFGGKPTFFPPDAQNTSQNCRF